jgi:hypothetical protein
MVKQAFQNIVVIVLTHIVDQILVEDLEVNTHSTVADRPPKKYFDREIHHIIPRSCINSFLINFHFKYSKLN